MVLGAAHAWTAAALRAVVTGVRASWRLGCALARGISAEARGGRGAAQRGVEAVGLAAERGRRRGPAAAVAWISRSRSWGGPPGFWISRFEAWRFCGGISGIRGARASPEASYCSEAASPAATGFGCDTGVAGVGAEEDRLGKLLGVTTDLLRGFAGAGMQLGGGFTAAQSPARRSSARRGRAGFWRRLGGEVGSRGSAEGAI